MVGEAVPLPFADGAFERLVTGHFYGHLQRDEADAFLAEAHRVAGELVIVDSAGTPPREAWDERVLDDGSRHASTSAGSPARRWLPRLGGEVLHDGRWFVVVRAYVIRL